MRKFLLTSTAVLGATMGLAGVANAQVTVTMPTMPPPPINTPGPSAGTSNAVPPGASEAFGAGMTAPNTFVVHLNGRINWYATVEGSSGDHFAGNKIDPYTFLGYIRLYPGFNATAANGLKYGAIAEIRHNNAQGGNSPVATVGSSTLQWRRAYGYIGTDQLGSIRFGQGDGPMSIFQIGAFDGFNDGAWNGDIPSAATGATFPVYPFTDVSALYTSDKLVYLSPNLSGVEFGVGFEPNTTNLTDAGICGTAAASTCANTSSTSTPNIIGTVGGRRRNTIDVGGQYTGTFNGVGVNVGGGYIASEKVNAPGQQFLGLSVGQVGATITVAGLTVGGNVSYGSQNGDFGALQPKGGRHEVAWLVGGQYSAGPATVGASYFQTQFAGNSAASTPATPVARTENDTGLAVGGTYNFVPGMAFYVSFLYGQRHERGFDFNAGAPGPGGNNTHVTIFGAGGVLSW